MNNVEKRIGSFHNVVKNIFSLSILQLFNYVYPLIFYPFITKALGPDKFGVISFVTAYIAYFIIIVDYGFNLTATQQITLNRDDKNKIEQIYNAVTNAKILLFFISFLIVLFSVFTITEFKNEKILCLIIFSGVFSNVMVPIWFFQGIEKMKMITILNIIPKVIVIPFVIFVIKTPTDYILFSIITSLAMISSGVASIILLKYKYSIKYKISSLSAIIEQLRYGFDIFLAGALTSFYTVTAVFALGFYAGKVDVGYYSLAEKIVKALGTIFVPVISAMYPFIIKISLQDNKKSVYINNRVLIFSCVIMTLLSSLIYGYASEIIVFFAGQQFEPASKILKVLSLFPLVITVARYLSMNYIMVNNLKRSLLKIYAMAAGISIISFASFIPRYGVLGAAYAVLIVEITATILMVVLCFKKRLFCDAK